jgi:hypothetical protein
MSLSKSVPAPLAKLLLASGLLAGCSAVLGLDDFEDPPSDATSSGATGSGAQGADGGAGAGAAGGGGGQGAAGGSPQQECGNGVVDPGELCFTLPYSSFPTQGEQARGLVLVDCDADLDLDVVVSNWAGGQLMALRNDGTGTFSEVVPSGSSNGIASLELSQLSESTYEIVGVFDVSGRTYWFTPDLAVPCAHQSTFSTATQEGLWDLVVFDANGNQNPDVAKVGPDALSSGDIFFNIDHGGDLTSINAYDTTPTAIAAGDFVGDAGDDLIVTATSQNTLALFENVAGAFSMATYVPSSGVGDEPVDVAVGDIDGDGDPDIVTANQGSNTIAVLYNLGAGTFSAQAPEPSVAGTNGVAASRPRAIALGDLDDDGHLDAATANHDASSGQSSVSVFLNDGTGKLGLATQASFPLVGADAPLEVRPEPWAIRIGDLNGDGVLDIVTSHTSVEAGTSAISVLLQDP